MAPHHPRAHRQIGQLIDDDEGEKREIVFIRFNSDKKAWVGVTSKLDVFDSDDVDDIEEYYLNGEMDKRIKFYSSTYGVKQNSSARPSNDPWFEHRHSIVESLTVSPR